VAARENEVGVGRVELGSGVVSEAGMLRIERGMRAVLTPWRAAGDDEEDGIGIAWQRQY
jgi:hypothetical protein